MMKIENIFPGPRFVMLGGFLGAGKTTTVLRLAAWLQARGRKVGVVTNDQAAGLVDTALAEELDLPVREIAGGCFCCRSESLVEALERLGVESKPDVFIAEPVGSCTDLVATVSLPLTQVYGKEFAMAPYAVLVDPFRAEQVLGCRWEARGDTESSSAPDPKPAAIARRRLTAAQARDLEKRAPGAKAIMAEMEEVIGKIGRGWRSDAGGVLAPPSGAPAARPESAGGSGSGFHADVNYIYRKQLEEAEIIVINKVDLIGGGRLASLRAELAREFPQARVMEVASREGIALEPLFEILQAETSAPQAVMEVDYARYGVGEAMLGWVNARATLECRTSRVGFNPDVWLMELAQGIHRRLRRAGIEIAHMKLALDGGEAGLAAVQLTRSEGEPEAGRTLGKKVRGGRLLVNLRAEADPAVLERAVRAALRAATSPASEVRAGEVAVDAFRPGQPVPSHRVAAV